VLQTLSPQLLGEVVAATHTQLMSKVRVWAHSQLRHERRVHDLLRANAKAACLLQAPRSLLSFSLSLFRSPTSSTRP
jgi:hypothetical protein